MIHKDTPPISERRRAKRLPVPSGTVAYIKNSKGSTDKVYVKDISAVGILVYGYYSDVTYPLNTLVTDIVISIPACKLRGTSRISLVVGEGKVVRSFFDRASQSTCYGIEFTHKSLSFNDKIEKLVKNDAICKRLKQLVGPE